MTRPSHESIWPTVVTLLVGAGGLAACAPGLDLADEVHEGASTPTHLRQQRHTTTLLFDPGRDRSSVGFHSFRIPSLVRTASGALLAFAEGRRCSAADFGDINSRADLTAPPLVSLTPLASAR